MAEYTDEEIKKIIEDRDYHKERFDKLASAVEDLIWFYNRKLN